MVSPGCITANQVDPVALAILQAKTSSGQYIIPSANAPNEKAALSLSTLHQGPIQPIQRHSGERKRRLQLRSERPPRGQVLLSKRSDNTFHSRSVRCSGSRKPCMRASQMVSLDNTTILNSQYHLGEPLRLYSRSGQCHHGAFADTHRTWILTFWVPNTFPESPSRTPTRSVLLHGGTITPITGNKMSIGPATNFANAGIFQNKYEGSSTYTGCTAVTPSLSAASSITCS